MDVAATLAPDIIGSVLLRDRTLVEFPSSDLTVGISVFSPI